VDRRAGDACPVLQHALSPLITLFDGLTRRLNAHIRVDTDIEKPYTD